MGRYRDLLILREPWERSEFRRFERPATLLVRAPAEILRCPYFVCGLELRYVFDRHLVTWEDRQLRVLLENRLRAPGYRLFTMLTPEEIIAAANEPMPGPG